MKVVKNRKMCIVMTQPFTHGSVGVYSLGGNTSNIQVANVGWTQGYFCLKGSGPMVLDYIMPIARYSHTL